MVSSSDDGADDADRQGDEAAHRVVHPDEDGGVPAGSLGRQVPHCVEDRGGQHHRQGDAAQAAALMATDEHSMLITLRAAAGAEVRLRARRGGRVRQHPYTGAAMDFLFTPPSQRVGERPRSARNDERDGVHDHSGPAVLQEPPAPSETAVEGLNPQQREAVLHGGSPLLIVAGA